MKFLLYQVASKYWAPQTSGNHSEFDAEIVDQIYMQEIRGSKFTIRRIMMLEFSQYLENYLWPHYKPGTSSSHQGLSIVIMVNEKFRERVSAWQVKSTFLDACFNKIEHIGILFFYVADFSEIPRKFSCLS